MFILNPLLRKLSCFKSLFGIFQFALHGKIGLFWSDPTHPFDEPTEQSAAWNETIGCMSQLVSVYSLEEDSDLALLGIEDSWCLNYHH